MPRAGPFGPIPLSDERIAPPDDLTGPARELFLDLVQAVRPRHFQPCDIPLLSSYARAIVIEREAALMIQDNIKGATLAVIRVQQMAFQVVHRLAIRLRLSPQGRQPTLSNANTKPSNNHSYYDRMRLMGIDDDLADRD
jgi:hypothetical protein